MDGDFEGVEESLRDEVEEDLDRSLYRTRYSYNPSAKLESGDEYSLPRNSPEEKKMALGPTDPNE